MKAQEAHIYESELAILREELRRAEHDRDKLSRHQARILESLHKHYSERIIALTDKIIELTGGPVGIKLKNERLENKEEDGFVDLDQAPPEEIRKQLLNGHF